MIESEAWPSLWRRHLDTYLAKPPRTGYWVHTWFGRKANSFLELGCGSGRDALYLANKGHRVVGTDLDAETLDELNRRFQKDTLSFRPADAASLDFPDDGFDVVDNPFRSPSLLLIGVWSVLSHRVSERTY